MEEERENCTARYCLDVDAALLTFYPTGVYFFLTASFLLLSSTSH